MNQKPLRTETRTAGARFLLLERITAGALLLVLAALGWMVLMAFQPDQGRLSSTEREVVVVLVLLVGALLLVSLVALFHAE